MTEYNPPLLCNSQEMIQELFDEINGYLEDQGRTTSPSTQSSNDTELIENTGAGAGTLLGQYDHYCNLKPVQPTPQDDVFLENEDRLRHHLEDLALDEPMEGTQSTPCNYKATTCVSSWNESASHCQYSNQDDDYCDDETGVSMPPTRIIPLDDFDTQNHNDDVLNMLPDGNKHLVEGLPLLTHAQRIGEPHTVVLRTNMARDVGSHEDRINAYNNAYSHCIMAGTDLVPWIKKQYTKGPPDLMMHYTPQSRQPSKARFGLFKRYSRSVNPMPQSIIAPANSYTDVSKSSGSSVSSPILSSQLSSHIQQTPIDQPALSSNTENQHALHNDTSFMQYQGPPSPIPSSSSSATKDRSASSLNSKSSTPMSFNDSKHSWNRHLSPSNDLPLSNPHPQPTRIVSPYHRRSHNQRQETQDREQYPWYQPTPSCHLFPPDQDHHFSLRPYRSTSNIDMQSFSYTTPYSSHNATQNRAIYRARSNDPLDPRAYNATMEMRRRQRFSTPPSTYYHPSGNVIPSRPRRRSGSTPGCSKRPTIRRRSTGNDNRYNSDYGYPAKHHRHQQPTALDGLGAFFPQMPKHTLALYLQEAQGDFYLAKDLCIEDIMTGRV